MNKNKKNKVQGVSKKRYFSGFCLISVPEVGFCFFTCVMESEFRSRFIWPLKLYPFRILTALKMQKRMHGHDFYPTFYKWSLTLSFSCQYRHGPMHLVALDSQNISGFSELTFNENGRPWIWMCNAFHIHGGTLHICGRAFHGIHMDMHSKTMSVHAFFAILGQFRIWIDIIWVPRWNGLEILIP